MNITRRLGRLLPPLFCLLFVSTIALGADTNNTPPSATSPKVEEQKLSPVMEWCKEHPKIVDDVIIPIFGLGWLLLLIVLLYDPRKNKD